MTYRKDPNTLPTKAELQQYIHEYKLQAQSDANEHMERLFERSNELEQKFSSSLIIFASVILTIIGSIIVAREISPSPPAKVMLAGGFVALLLSIIAGLINYRSMSKFWLKWAKAEHELGSIIETDESRTYDDLAALRQKMIDHKSKLPQASSKLFGRIQISCFIISILLVVVVIIDVMFDSSLLRWMIVLYESIR